MSSIRVEKAREEFRRLKAAFRDRKLLDSRFYVQLKAAGCELEACTLVSFFPDGADTYCGVLIRQDGRIFEFDIALRNPLDCEWKDCTRDFLQRYDQIRKSQPWSTAVVAYEDFMRDRKAKGQSS